MIQHYANEHTLEELMIFGYHVDMLKIYIAETNAK